MKLDKIKKKQLKEIKKSFEDDTLNLIKLKIIIIYFIKKNIKYTFNFLIYTFFLLNLFKK